MTALQKSGFYWFCTYCRTDQRTSQRKILSNNSSQTSPMSSQLVPLPSITIIPLHLHPTYLHNPLFLHLHRSPHHPSLHPKPYPSHTPTLPLFLPSLLSPLAYPLLPLNDHNPSLP